MNPLTKEVMLEEFRKTSAMYCVDHLIGQGAFGEVYQAHRKDDKKKFVAIKRMNSVREGMGIPQDAYREIKILKELSRFPHENIVKLKRVFMDPQVSSTGSALSLVYDYAENDLGEMLRYHRKNNLKIDPLMVKSITWQLLSGIKFLHSHFILHRDLKPQNILVTQPSSGNSTVKIADFGLARLFADPLRTLAADGDVVTIWYRAPELLLQSKHYTRAIDIWAVGCIVAELIICRAVFPGTEVKQKGAFQGDQLKKIFHLLGKPTSREWPHLFACKYAAEIEAWPASDFRPCLDEYLHLDRNSALYDLLLRLLDYDPTRRITAEEALKHRYFQETPTPRLNACECSNGVVQRYPTKKPLVLPTTAK